MQFKLMELPFDPKALEPYISEETIRYHYGKHHQGYVDKLNALIEGTPYERMSLSEIILRSEGAVFNNASQVYNHNVYFKGLSGEWTEPSAGLLKQLEHDFGSFYDFKEQYKSAALKLFGSGWVWLCMDQEKRLQLRSYSNAESPLQEKHVTLMTCDVWEHAYYIDYRNARIDYFDKWWEVIDWSYVSENYARAVALDFTCDAAYGDVCEIHTS